MTNVERRIDVDVPVTVAYDQWTQFESFPRFMDGVLKVEQRDDRTLDWVVTVGGQRREWTARIVDQTPNQRIAWKSVAGTANAGAVLFAPLGADRTRITLRIDAEPDGIVDRMGEASASSTGGSRATSSASRRSSRSAARPRAPGAARSTATRSSTAAR